MFAILFECSVSTRRRRDELVRRFIGITGYERIGNWRHQGNEHKQGRHHNGDRAARRPHSTCIVLDLRSLICGFGESCTIVYCTTSQQMYHKMCSIRIFVNLQI